VWLFRNVVWRRDHAEIAGGADLVAHARSEHRRIERLLERLREPDVLKGTCGSELRHG
jgi:hypothetical protein